MKINPTAPNRIRTNAAELRSHGWSLPRIAAFLGVSVPHLRGSMNGGRCLGRRAAVKLHLKAEASRLSR